MSKDILNDKIKQMQLAILLADAFPDIQKLIGISYEEISDLTGVDIDKISKIADREYIPVWNEYMSLIFLFMTNDKSRSFVLEKGLFPDELKDALSINRKVHE